MVAALPVARGTATAYTSGMLLMLEVFTVEETPYMAWFILGAFLAGSIPFAWLAARAKKVDLRKVGSGNIGGTNAWRALGWKWGLAVMLLDAMKGFVPVAVWLAYGCGMMRDFNGFADTTFPPGPGPLSPQVFLSPITMLVGLAAILGHTFTPWLKFKGGKGVATSAGVLIALFQWWSLVPLAVFGITLGLTRMVSLSSIAAALSLAVMSLAGPLFHAPHAPGLGAYWPFAVLTALLVLYTHRTNIRRIIAGDEPRIGRRKQA